MVLKLTSFLCSWVARRGRGVEMIKQGRAKAETSIDVPSPLGKHPSSQHEVSNRWNAQYRKDHPDNGARARM